MNVRIVQVAPDYVPVPPSGYGGIERIVYELTEVLVKEGHEVFLYALPNSTSSATIIEYKHVADDRKIVPFIQETLPENIDIIHDHTHGSVVTTLELDIPYLSTIHIPWYNDSRNPVFACNEMRNKLAEGRGFTCFHGLNSNNYPLKEEKGNYLLFLGRLVTEKGIHHAIEVSKQTNMPIIIAGPTDVVEADKYSRYASSILTEIDKNPLLHYVGEVSGDRKISLLQNAYCLLFPSDPEAFGLVIIEALFCGTPVLGFNHGSVPEILQEFPALLCSSTNEMAQKINNTKMPAPHLLREYAKKFFTSERMTERYLEIYQVLINEKQHVPKVSVLLPVFNSKKYLKEAIDSIINQSFTDFELLLLDDGSTDGSTEILYNYEKIDPRVKVIRFEENIGLTNVLNHGISIAVGDYIARMDSDDIALPDRFALQVEFLNKNREIGLVGAAAKVIGRNEVWEQATDSEELKCQLLLHCCFIHPTIMMRKAVLVENNIWYSVDAPHAEDYELYRQLSKVTKLSNLPDVLLHYRLHPDQVSIKHQSTQHSTANEIKSRQLADLGINPTKEQLFVHFHLPYQNVSNTKKINWIYLLLNQNKIYNRYDNDTLANVLCTHANITLPNEAEVQIKQPTPKKICFVLLVHENRDQVIQLIKNIQHFCPNSHIVLYNGGDDPTLCTNLNIAVCPTSRKLTYGYTTIHFIETMEWIEAMTLDYDYFINIDSDALFVRRGFEEFITEQMKDADYMGVDFRIAEDTYLCGREIKKEAFRWEKLFRLDKLYGVFNVGQVMSRSFIKTLLHSSKKNLLKEYLIKTKAFGTDEVVFVNIAKSLGCKAKKYPVIEKHSSYKPIGYDMDKWLIRYRPHITIQEFIYFFNRYHNRWLCHPIDRGIDDPLRQLIYRLQNKETTDYRSDSYPWFQVDQTKYHPSNIIVSTTGHHEIIVNSENKLTHYYLVENRWYTSETFATLVSGIPVLFESSYRNLEVIAPLMKGGIGHWWRDPNNQTWHGPNRVTDEDVSPIFLCQLSDQRMIFVAKKREKIVYWIRDDGHTWNWYGAYD